MTTESRSIARTIGIALVSLAIVGSVAAFVIPALSGARPDDPNQTFSALLGFTLWPYLLARLMRWKRAWLFPTCGVVAYFAVFIVSGAVRGFERRQELQASEARLLKALEDFDPEVARAARAAEGNGAAMQRVLVPAMARASKRASDRALMGVWNGTIAMIRTDKGINVPRCVSALMGTPAPAATAADVDATLEPMIGVLESAAANHELPREIDLARARALTNQEWTRADSAHVLQDEKALSALPDSDKCALLLRYADGIRLLPAEDAALVIRFNATSAR